MDDLAERIIASIEDPNGEPWFPELTECLATRAWENLHNDIGLTPDSYGTERVISRSLSTQREIITSLKTDPSTCTTGQAITIEALTQGSINKYQKQGISFYSADEILHTTVLSCIEDALAIINKVPSLMKTIATLVRSLHLIKPEDTDHDVSFSEPDIPFSIFVSVPEKRIANDVLRVAEAIVHETMHLQLTLLEKAVLLTLPSTNRYFSPWRKQHRDARGLLHGIYVFSIINRFLGQLLSSRSAKPEPAKYVSVRRREISQQIAETISFSRSVDLTNNGAYLAEALLAVHNPRITAERQRPSTQTE